MTAARGPAGAVGPYSAGSRTTLVRTAAGTYAGVAAAGMRTLRRHAGATILDVTS